MITHSLTPRRGGLVAALAGLVLAALVAWPAPGDATDRTETLRFYVKDVSMTLTKSDGTVVRDAPLPDVAPGDVLDVNSLLYRGTQRRHAKRASASAHLRCRFTASPEPDCESHTAIGGSLLVFRGSPGTLVNGTGRYQGATGRVVKSTQVPGGADVVSRIQLHGGS